MLNKNREYDLIAYTEMFRANNKTIPITLYHNDDLGVGLKFTYDSNDEWVCRLTTDQLNSIREYDLIAKDK